VGLGLPWLISAIYAAKHDQPYKTPPGNLAFSVMLFLITSCICFAILLLRRATLGGELGGPIASKTVSSVILVLLWVTYVFFSSLRAYNLIDGI
jgi:heme/copper-type cytochrome/quinol oxidase subunit 3